MKKETVLKNYIKSLKERISKQQKELSLLHQQVSLFEGKFKLLNRQLNVMGGLHNRLFDEYNTHLIDFHNYKECENCAEVVSEELIEIGNFLVCNDCLEDINNYTQEDADIEKVEHIIHSGE